MDDQRSDRYTEIYHSFTIVAERVFPTPGDYRRWHFSVAQRDEHIFGYSTQVSGSQAVLLGGDERADRLLFEFGLKRVHGIISLGRHREEDGNTYHLRAEAQETNALGSEEIRLHILDVLERIREQDPIRYKFTDFDVNGVCDILGISHQAYLSNAVYLREAGFVADSITQQKILENGGIYITTEGINYLESQLRRNRETKMSADANAVRKRMLEILEEFEETGDTGYLVASEFEALLELTEREVNRHLEVLNREQCIKLIKTGASQWSAKIDTIGTQVVKEGLPYPPHVAANLVSYNNSFNNNTGVVNAGNNAQLDSIHVNINQLADEGHNEVAAALKQIADAVAQSQEYADEERDEILALLENLSEQASLQPQQRMKMPLLRALLHRVPSLLTMGGAAAEIWTAVEPVIRGYLETS